MKLTLLGTGGAEGIPALFCQSRVSQYARQHGGKDIRARSSALVNDDLKLDLGPDSWSQVNSLGIDTSLWSGIFYTHSHEDHFAISELQYALYPFCDREFPPFTIYGNDTICAKISSHYPDWPFELVQTNHFVTIEHQGYRVTPVHANHKLDENCQNFLIEQDGKTLLYATDTGIWGEETWEFLSRFKIDCLVIECTNGFVPTEYYGHLDITDCVQVVERLRNSHILHSSSSVFTTHHGHLGDATHAELTAALKKYEIVPGYDGLVIDV